MNQANYQVDDWNNYALAHASVLTSYQWALFREAVEPLTGDVIDCGCGTARLAPLLADKAAVRSYTGVDYSPQMVEVAGELIGQLGAANFRMLNAKIEQVEGRYDSAVSVHSYYSWPEPELVLQSIYDKLRPGGSFVLVTPNPQMDMPLLLRETDKELLGHPNYRVFREQNMLLFNNEAANFVTMDSLVAEVRQVGFKLVECHQKHYLGGVNLLHLQR